MDLSTAGSLDMKFVLELYQQAFPEEERKPFSLIERKAAMGSMEVLVIREEGRRVGLAIVAFGEHMVLLDYFAISGQARGQGLGTEAFQLLREFYADYQFYLEIERPAPGFPERTRRREFYLRNGMLETGIYVNLLGVEMELLAAKPGLRYEQCEQLYRELLGPMYRNMVKQIP